MCRLFITQLLQNRLVLSAFQSDHGVGYIYVDLFTSVIHYCVTQAASDKTAVPSGVDTSITLWSVGRSIGACECVEWPAWENDDRVDEVVGSNYISDPHRL